MENLILEYAEQLPGPVLILGASGFIGANLFKAMSFRSDAHGTVGTSHPWRLDGMPKQQMHSMDLLIDQNIQALLSEIRPRTIFNCAAYGAYSFETDQSLIYQTNFQFLVNLLEVASDLGVHSFVQAGTSSEYGRYAAAPKESVMATPNSHYAVSKCASAAAIHYMGQECGLPCANLRIYSAFGPLEDISRLIPQVVTCGLNRKLPDFVDPDISRDFIYIDDVIEAFLAVGINLSSSNYGQSFNIGSGKRTTIRELADLSRELFDIEELPSFSMPNRRWDVPDWYSDPSKAEEILGWVSRTSLRKGLLETKQWYEALGGFEKSFYLKSSKHSAEILAKRSISAIVACYNDAKAIPIMYERLRDCFESIGITYEIIFVNDSSPDDSESVILQLTGKDQNVIGISHSRNFGSQAAFVSGMEVSTKDAVVLLDGDLQDPPELISQFIDKWREGFDVVYGTRVKRQAPWYMQIAYKLFYRIFDKFSYLRIPHDAGDFSLLDGRVVKKLLSFPEKDIFLRGLRAFVGFRQIGVEYVRPERMFGRTTNSLSKNIGWAKKGIFSFSYVPLNLLTVFSVVLFFVVILLGLILILTKLFFPESAPRGIPTLLLVNLGFGATILLALSLLGEYIARIFEEVKSRPRFIRRSILRRGKIREL